MRMWFDIESREIVMENELQKEYEQALLDGIPDGITFDEFVWNCQTRCNGTLMEIENAYLFQHI